jgi:hypothetical protein
MTPCVGISTVSSSLPAKNPSPSAILTVLGNSLALKNSVVKAIEASLQRLAGPRERGGTLIALVYV